MLYIDLLLGWSVFLIKQGFMHFGKDTTYLWVQNIKMTTLIYWQRYYLPGFSTENSKTTSDQKEPSYRAHTKRFQDL